jgi:predicted phosphate transport protein (TIGR00153 family)
MALLLKTTKFIESQIDAFLDIVSDSATLFHLAMEDYLKDRIGQFEERLSHIRENEQKADDLRVGIERFLYERTLIPENRGDVLAILENTDEVIDNIKDSILQFSIEMPQIPEELDDLWMQTTRASVNAVDQLTFAVRSFFRDLPAVNNYIHKVYFFEREADQIGEKLRRHIFSLDIELSRKSQLRFFAIHIEKISDYAQAVCDRLAIYAIKRQL